MNEALRKDYSLILRGTRQTICLYLLASGDFTSILCYGYIIKDGMSLEAVMIVQEIQEKYISGQWKQSEIPVANSNSFSFRKAEFYLGSIQICRKAKV